MGTNTKRRQHRIFHQHWPVIAIVSFMAVTGMTGSGAFSLSSLPPILHSPSRTLLSSTTDDAATTAPISIPPRNAKHRKSRKKNTRKKVETSTALSPQQIAHHVANEYLHGSGGVLRTSLAKSARRHTEEHDHATYLRKLDRHPALVLNADYQPMSKLPLSLWNWQEAIKAVFSGKVTVVDVYPDVMIRAANLEIPLPSVIALNEYVPQFDQRPAFTKRNVFLRDEYRCQYCNDAFHTRDLSLDHVVPRCLGGRLTWDNAVTCCRKCNGRKGSLPVQQLRSVGMRLLREPFVPSQYQLAANANRMLPQRVHPTWAPYLVRQGSPSKKAVLEKAEEEAFLDDV